MAELAGPVVPGHPLYADIQGKEVIKTFLVERFHLSEGMADQQAHQILAALVKHDPPIYLAVEEDLRDEGENILDQER